MLLIVNITKRFGDNVRKHRQARGWSQEKLAEIADVHRTYVSGIERGARNPTLTIVLQFAQALGVKPEELLADDDS